MDVYEIVSLVLLVWWFYDTRLCLLTDSQPGGSETPSTTNRPHPGLQDSKTEDKYSSQIPSGSSFPPTSPPSLKSTLQSIRGLLELSIICLPGTFTS